MRAIEVVQIKKHPVPVVQQTDSVLTAVKKMLELQESGLLILTPKGDLVGIVTEKDVMRLVAERYTLLNKIEVWEIMSKSLTTVDADTPLEAVLTIMGEKNIHHLPLMKEGKPLGLISSDDIIRARLQKSEHEAEMLKEYIQKQ
ncbi:MAG TPA: CBS domain-containing protein [Turneriella sp.]|nr:CBS domain-containing protein [Turneriella sp.]